MRKFDFSATLMIIILLLLNCTFLKSQSNKKFLDKKAIKSMLGCFDVEFKYTETFAPEVDYEQAYDYTSTAFEWAELVEETDNKIVIQHLLIINDSIIIKHWRQDWVFEAEVEFRYKKDNEWLFEPLDSIYNSGKWTQSVYQVDDSPRYSGTATWTHVDGRSTWYNKADSPLPRREYSKRSDYNVMKRGNRVQITKDGWLHEQDNDKVIRTDSSDVLLVQEKGYNTYKRRTANDCQYAKTYWEENQLMWKDVRSIWEDIYSGSKELRLHDKIEGKKLYEHLFFSDVALEKKKMEEIISSYLIENRHK